MSQLSERQTRLLEALKAEGGVIRASRVHDLNRGLGAPKRTTARHDLAALRKRGLLIQGGAEDGRFYLLTRKVTT
ncbi:hypothetical protein [Streptomyces sp.]|uniref:hypothetical protein n=1 Tax=Streptomyces sp. TaxID=1931 RepID=UPI002810E57F|nr:hypothetical protein [Streptomyces sp.]